MKMLKRKNRRALDALDLSGIQRSEYKDLRPEFKLGSSCYLEFVSVEGLKKAREARRNLVRSFRSIGEGSDAKQLRA